MIGKASVLLATFADRRIVALPQGFALVPIEERQSEEAIGRFYDLTEPLRSRLQASSANGAVAYVEAEFFGGRGTQSAIAWTDGAVVLGPLHTQTHDGEEAGYTVSGDLAINQALRVLGVAGVGSYDEFEALGLGQFHDPKDSAPANSGGVDARSPGTQIGEDSGPR